MNTSVWVLIIVICIFLLYSAFHRVELYQGLQISCVYAYYEKNDVYKENLEYFLQKGGLLPFVEYYFVINGSSSVNLPNHNNIHVLHRENVGYDFGAWGAALYTFPEIRDSDYIFFMNTSVKGPYTPHRDWTRPFLQLFNHPNTKLVGTSINISSSDFSASSYGYKKVYPHVQSMFFVVDKDALEFLLARGLFNVDKTLPFEELIAEKEVGMSIMILNNKWNINCILPRYKNRDYMTISEDINPTSHSGDAYYENAYFGKSIQPSDVIFFKNTRFVY